MYVFADIMSIHKEVHKSQAICINLASIVEESTGTLDNAFKIVLRPISNGPQVPWGAGFSGRHTNPWWAMVAELAGTGTGGRDEDVFAVEYDE